MVKVCYGVGRHSRCVDCLGWIMERTAHDGSPAKFWADTKLPPTATRAIKVVLMLNNRLDGLQLSS